MSKRQELEKRKLSECARIAQGFGNGFSVAGGLVVNGELLAISDGLGSKGIVIPCQDSPHIMIVVGTE